MKIIVNGCTGRMGGAICSLAQHTDGIELSAGVSPELENTDETHFLRLSDVNVHADCVVDFSNHAATGELISFCLDRKLPVVIATTGQTDAENEMISEAAKSIPVFRSANMSLGVAFLGDVAKKAAALFPDADIEITEIHHNQKLDVPSGTALMIADKIKEAKPDSRFVIGRSGYGKREKNEIGISSVRMGNQVGTHTVYIDTGSELLSFSHQVNSRTLFAEGALRAARFIAGKKNGLYTMKDMVEI